MAAQANQPVHNDLFFCHIDQLFKFKISSTAPEKTNLREAHLRVRLQPDY